ncbi:hypothetical protein PVAP13_6KG365900 [Panicum virgatum]|uniref:Non-structural maintenance of chromosomes element 4 n=1 Tax=Panicum virgatum TaxID=38727 RepID=A0A8T0RJY6_PANVG|nr:hypothetical protein PVAP13_6KG365900 [Panicum virgatum]
MWNSTGSSAFGTGGGAGERGSAVGGGAERVGVGEREIAEAGLDPEEEGRRGRVGGEEVEELGGQREGRARRGAERAAPRADGEREEGEARVVGAVPEAERGAPREGGDEVEAELPRVADRREAGLERQPEHADRHLSPHKRPVVVAELDPHLQRPRPLPWQEEFAAAWGQSCEERGALRSAYGAAREMIRELKDDPALDKFDAAMHRIEKLHEKVQRPLEQLSDAEALLDLADVLVSSTKAENRDGPTPSEFVTALLRKFGGTATPLDDSNEPFSWSSLGGAASTLFMTATGCQTMHGPMGREIKERRHAFRRESVRLDSRPAEPHALALDQDERNDTDKNIAVMFDLLCHHKSVKLEHLILNRQSFAQTVENIFVLSFLVKDGRAEINVVDGGDHFVAPRNAPAAGLITSRKVSNSQFVFRFDTEDWQERK